jgi:hypothetical protein
LKKILIILLFPVISFSQRGNTGDEVFKHIFPPNVYNKISKSSLTVSNNVDHDVIVLIRDQSKKYLRHTYIRNGDFFTFKNIPITRLYVQFKSLEFFFEDRERTVINFGEKHTFNFFYDASMSGNYFIISEEEFFKP